MHSLMMKGGTGLQDSPCLHHPTSITVRTTPHFFPSPPWAGNTREGCCLVCVSPAAWCVLDLLPGLLAHKSRHNSPVAMNHKNLTVVIVSCNRVCRSSNQTILGLDKLELSYDMCLCE